MRQRVRLAATLFVATAGVVFAVFMFVGRRGPMPSDMFAVVDHDALGELETFRASDLGDRTQDLREVRDAVAAQVQGNIVSRAHGAGFGVDAARDLGAVAADRLALYVAPEWSAYTEHVFHLTGRSPDPAADAGQGATARESWERLARVYGRAEYDLDNVVVRPSLRDGDSLWTPGGGRYTTSTDARGKYLAGESSVPARDVWDVVIPIRIERWPGADGPVNLFLIHSYRQRPSDGRWVPYRMGVYDPAGRSRWLPTPWL
jgi:hypothetical protein